MSNIELLTRDDESEILGILKQYQGVIVSVSGGADSIGLLHALHTLSDSQKKFSIAAIHIAYGLRGQDSRDDFALCAWHCQKRGIPLYVSTVTDKERASRKGQSLQEWARTVRHTSYDPWISKGWVVALGHHMGDLAENVLIRLARGAAPHNLLGMAFFKAPYLRPFLNHAKNEIIRYNQAHHIMWREDLSNASNDYSRNVIRNEIIPKLEGLFPGASKRMVSCAEEARGVYSADPASLGMKRLTAATEFEGTPISRRRLDAAIKLGVQAVKERSSPKDPKAIRASQHRQSLETPKVPSKIAEGSYGFFTLDKPL